MGLDTPLCSLIVEVLEQTGAVIEWEIDNIYNMPGGLFTETWEYRNVA